MRRPRFEWDEAKNRANERKHGVRFEEAATAFHDSHGLRGHDPDHSVAEARFLLLAISFSLRVLVVSHCYRSELSVVRIISARKANRHEQQAYWNSR